MQTNPRRLFGKQKSVIICGRALHCEHCSGKVTPDNSDVRKIYRASLRLVVVLV